MYTHLVDFLETGYPHVGDVVVVSDRFMLAHRNITRIRLLTIYIYCWKCITKNTCWHFKYLRQQTKVLLIRNLTVRTRSIVKLYYLKFNKIYNLLWAQQNIYARIRDEKIRVEIINRILLLKRLNCSINFFDFTYIFFHV